MNLLKLNTLTLLVLGLYSVAMLACGLADESVQREIGNLPLVAPPQQDESSSDATTGPGTKETPPTPIPTRCVHLPDKEGNLEAEATCYTPVTEIPIKYNKIAGQLDGAAQEAEEQAKSDRRRSDVNPGHGNSVMVLIYVNEEEEGAADTIKAWLKSKNITYKADPDDLFFSAGVPYTLIGPLSELSAVRVIREEIPGAIQ